MARLFSLHTGAALAMLLACAGLAAAQGAPEVDPITLAIGSAEGNRGDTVEIDVSLVSGDTEPATLITFIAFDPDVLQVDEEAFEIVLTDSFGNPIQDNMGNTLFRRAPVRPGSSLPEDKGLDYQVFAEDGLVGVFIGAVNNSPIPDGPLFTLAFRILEAAPEDSVSTLDGVDSNSPVFVGDDAFASSAAVTLLVDGMQVETGFQVNVVDGQAAITCVPSEAPGNVTATTGNPDAVTIAWDAVATPGAQYRVFRATENNVAAAVPLGDAWQSALTFDDITALAPLVVGRDACNPGTVEPVVYFYWVKSRSATGCESAFSAAPATGSRGAAKSAANPRAASGQGTAYAALCAALLIAAWRRARAAAR